MADTTSANDSSGQSDKATSSQFEGDAATAQRDTATAQHNETTALPSTAADQPSAVAAPTPEEDTHVTWSTLMAVFVSDTGITGTHQITIKH